MTGHFGGEGFAEFGALFVPHTEDVVHLIDSLRIFPGNLTKGGIAEDDVGGHAAFVGDFFSEGAEASEEDFVAVDFALAAAADFGRFWGDEGFGEGDGRALTQDIQSLGGELDGRILALGLHQETEAQEFAENGLPLRAGKVFADAVGAEFVMVPPADFIGVGPGEDFDEVVGAGAEAGVLAHAVDGGEKFLGNDGAVVGFAGLDAVVAAVAVGIGVGFAEIAK